MEILSGEHSVPSTATLERGEIRSWASSEVGEFTVAAVERPPSD